MELTDDDVLEILKLFEQSQFDFLELLQGERKITLSKGGYVHAGSTVAAAAPAAAPTGAPPAALARPAPAARAAPAAKPTAAPIAEGLVPVTAPMVGKFYSAPAPSDPPYVEVGSKVVSGATVGLIEVMKVFASIKTEVAGTIEKILVTNGEFVEAGQALYLIRPA